MMVCDLPSVFILLAVKLVETLQAMGWVSGFVLRIDTNMQDNCYTR